MRPAPAIPAQTGAHDIAAAAAFLGAVDTLVDQLGRERALTLVFQTWRALRGGTSCR